MTGPLALGLVLYVLPIGLFGIALFSLTLLSFSTFQCKMFGNVTSSIN